MTAPPRAVRLTLAPPVSMPSTRSPRPPHPPRAPRASHAAPQVARSGAPSGTPPGVSPAGTPVDLGGRLTTRALYAIAVEGAPAVVGPAARGRMHASSAALARCVEERRLVYGVTTGFGPLARHHVDPAHAATLQRNLLYHLASGVGRPLAVAHARALMAARAASLARGFSGVGDAVHGLLVACLNRGVVPVVPEQGTVGASGDLTPLAHVALVLVGEGEAWVAAAADDAGRAADDARGAPLPGADALAAAGLAPVTLGHKEALALVNGTSAMTGIAAVNAERARRAATLMARLAVLHAETMGGHLEAWDARFALARPHAGQRAAHAALLALAGGSARLTPSVQPPPPLGAVGPDGVHSAPEPPQDPYTIRCVPQELGAILDVLAFHDGVVETELNSATDNPLVFTGDDAAEAEGDWAVLHGGNFYGQHVAFASDALAMAVTKLAAWSERALARLTNPVYNRGLPAFLHGGAPGLHSGFMGAQVTASALVAEMRTLAVPASIQTIPTNNDNQDVVTMGTIAARKASTLLDHAWRVLAIQALALAQGAELRAGAIGADDAALARAGFSPASRALVAAVRGIAPPLHVDRSLSAEITTAAVALEAHALVETLPGA